MTKRKKIVDWEAKYKKEHKKVIHLKGKMRATEHTYEGMQLRKTGMTWMKIGKKLKVPESSIRLATQKRYKQAYLKGRWSEDKLSTSRVIDARTNAMLADAERNRRGQSFEEYVRETSSK